MKTKLVGGYFNEEKKKVEQLLSALLPYLVPNRFILVGGISTRYSAVRSKKMFPKRPLNDVDILIENKDVLLPSVTNDFLIYHYHPNQNYNGSYYIALVCPNTKTKIDFFDYSNKPDKVYRLKFGEYFVDVQSAEDQLVNTVHQIQRISSRDKVDPKQISDLKLLNRISNKNISEKIWMKKHFKEHKIDLKKAIERGLKLARECPDWLQVKPRRKGEPYVCKDCVNTTDFPITPMGTIYKLMGYVK